MKYLYFTLLNHVYQSHADMDMKDMDMNVAEEYINNNRELFFVRQFLVVRRVQPFPRGRFRFVNGVLH